MGKTTITIGVACLARKTFDFEAARDIYNGIKQQLARLDDAVLEIVEDLVFEMDEAERAATRLARAGVDCLVLVAGTFHLGHLALTFHKIVRRPVLLWGLDELPYNGGKIRLNSVCGVNLDASNLYKAGARDYHVCIGEAIDQGWIDAIRIKRTFSAVKLGLAGYRAHGFFNLDVDELDLFKETGVLVDHFELAAIFNQQVSTEVVATCKARLEATFDVSGISSAQLDKVAALAAKIDAFMATNGLGALALRCWPEFAAEYGVSPCAAMSLLQATGKIVTCEGDVLGAMSMLAHQAIGAGPPFLADFSQVNFKEDFALLWHCGVAPCSLWDGTCTRSLDTYFAGGKGVTADFVLKSGPVSIARIDYGGRAYRIFLQRATGVPMDKDLKGTYMKVTFAGGVRKVLDTVVTNGIAHHVSVAYGDHIRPFEILAKLLGWTVVQ